MARSIGEAIATGIDTGFSRVQQYQQQREVKARQDQMDQQHQQDRARTLGRQDDADALSALDRQQEMLAEENRVMEASGASPAAQQEFSGRVRSLRDAKNRRLSKASGLDVSATENQATEDLKALQENRLDLAKLPRGRLGMAAMVATRRDPADYMRAQGAPGAPGGMAPIEKAGTDVIEGLQANDMGRVIDGLNVLHAPDLRKGVGTDSPHGKIVDKKIIHLVRDPRNNDPENPSYIPVLRVYVNAGKDFRGPIPEGMPEDSTGYYDAPLTERRSAEKNDPPKSISLKDSKANLALQMQAVELLNTPEVRAKLQEDQDAYNKDEYLQAKGYVGSKAKNTTTLTGIPAGGLLERKVNQAGDVVSERRIDPTPKPQASRRAGTTQEKIDAVDALVANGDLTEDEGDAAKKGIVKTISTARPAGGGRGGAGGGSGSGGTLQSTKVNGDGFMIGVFRDGSSKKLMLDGKPIKAQDYAKRVDKLAADIGKSVDGIGKSAKDLRAEAEATLGAQMDAAPAAAEKKPAGKAGGLSKDEAAKKFGF